MIKLFFSFLFFLSTASAQVFSSYADSLINVLPDTEGEERVEILKELSWEIRIPDPQLSLFYAEQGIKLAEELNLKKLEATLFNVMGVTHTVLGNYDKALDYHLKSLSNREERDDTLGISASLNNIGVVYESSENYEKALEYYLRALEKKRLIGNKASIAISLNNIGFSYRKLGYLDKALDYHLDALKLNLELNYKSGLGLSYSNIGLIKKEKGELEEALDYTKKALDIREEINDKQGIAIQRMILGAIYRLKGNFDSAYQQHLLSINIAKDLNLRPILKDNYFELTQLFREKQEYRDALEYFEMFAELRDSLLNDQKSKQIFALQTKYEAERNQSRIKDLELERQTTIRNFLIVVTGLIIISIGLVYSRKKIKSSAAKTIKQTEELNTALISQLPEYVLIHINGIIVYANESMCEALDVSTDEIKNRSMYDFIVEDYKKVVNENFNQRLNGEEIPDYEIQIISLNGVKRFVLVKAAMISYNDQDATLVVLIDITDRKKNEAELLRAKESAEESNRLKSEFLAQMSHEIRSPINTILNFMYLIKDQMDTKELDEIKPAYTAIQSASERVIRTIDLILNMSQLQIGSYEVKLKEFDLYKDAIYPIYLELESKAYAKEIKFDLKNNAENTLIVADEYSVSQIFVNLIENALKYTNKGSVDIVISRTDGGKLSVKIVDTGIGISKPYFNKLFEPFTQEEQGYTRQYEGTGLGLALVKRYCDLNNAEVTVSSEKNVGTTFEVTFI